MVQLRSGRSAAREAVQALRHPERHRHGGQQPCHRPHIAFNYDVNNFEEGKAKCKEALQDRFGLNKDGSPVFAMVSRMVGMKGFDLVQSVADGLVDRGIELVILAAARASTRTSSPTCAAVIRAA